MRLQNRLKEIRLERQLTQEALADAVDVTRQTIIAIEKSKFGPSAELALRLASALEVPVETMFWLDRDEGGRP